MESITFRCSACNQVLKVSAEKAGRKVKCNKCGAPVTIPTAAEAAAPKATAAPKAAPATPAPAKAKADDDDDGGTYGLSDAFDKPPSAEETKKRRQDEQDEEDQDEEDGPKALLVPKVEGPGRRAGPKRRALVEPEKWLKVKLGVHVVAIGIWIWLGAYVLRQVPMIIGLFSPPEYAALAARYSDPKTYVQQMGGGGTVDDVHLNKAEFLIGLTTGSDSLQAGLWIARIAQIFVLIQGLVLLGGYGICLAVPPRFGTRSVIVALLALGSLNLILGVVFKLLPYVGAMDYAIVPAAIPEVAMLDANLERQTPLPVLMSSIPLFDYTLALFILLAYSAEPILFCIFLRSVALSMKNDRLDVLTQGMIRLGLGTAFMQLCFLMTSITGTSDVLLWVLRVVYILGACFFSGQLTWYAIEFMKVPALIDKEIDLAELEKNKPSAGEDEDEDEDKPRKKKPARDEDEDKPRKKKRVTDDDEDEDEE